MQKGFPRQRKHASRGYLPKQLNGLMTHARHGRHQVFDLGALLGKLPGSLGPGMQPLGQVAGRVQLEAPYLLLEIDGLLACSECSMAGLRMFTNLMVWIVLFGSLISYIIGICDSAQSFVQGAFLGSQRRLARLWHSFFGS